MWADEVKWRSSGSSNCLVGYKWKIGMNGGRSIGGRRTKDSIKGL
jgi:hypothetical protein